MWCFGGLAGEGMGTQKAEAFVCATDSESTPGEDRVSVIPETKEKLEGLKSKSFYI